MYVSMIFVIENLAAFLKSTKKSKQDANLLEFLLTANRKDRENR